MSDQKSASLPKYEEDKYQFSKLREFFWPVHHKELKKFLPMGFMLFFILFIYTALKDAKDSLIITAPLGGVEVIPFLKGYLVLPISVLFVIAYTKLSNIFSRDAIFYSLVIGFTSYLVLFVFYLYPNKDLIHPDPQIVMNWQESYPNFKYIFPIFGYWTYSIFYLFADLWGSIMINLMFWQFANEVTRTYEAKRFYSLFGFVATFAVFFAGAVEFYFTYVKHIDATNVAAYGQILQYIILAVIVAGLMIASIYYWMGKNVLVDPFYYDKAQSVVLHKEDKPKSSFKESLHIIFHSKYLGFIAILVISYGLCFGISELVWKAKVKELYPDPQQYHAFMSVLSMATSISSMIVVMLFKNIIRFYGWLSGALFTPIVFGLTSIMFFVVFFSEGIVTQLIGTMGISGLMTVVLIGFIQNIMTKSSKYSLFDPSKEMAYIPLDQELKVKGKAAVDVIGSRFGKGSSGFIVSFLLIVSSGNLTTIAPVIVAIIAVLTVFWVISVYRLNSLYKKELKKGTVL